MTKSKLLILIAPALLSFTALVQRYQAEVHGLNPWKGGGFGMFADIHRTEYRSLRVTLIDFRRQGGQNVGYRMRRVPKRFEQQAIAVRTLPTEERARNFARRLLAAPWLLAPAAERGRAPTPYLKEDRLRHEPGQALRLQAVKIEVVGYDFDPETNRLVASPLLDVQELVRRGARR